MPTSLRDERGSTLLLQVFLIAAAVLAVTVIADVGTAIAARQQLAATADQAALAGAQSLDLDSYYRQGATAAGLGLDPASAASAVHRYLAPAIAAAQQEGLEVEAVTVTDGELTVRLSCRAQLPFTATFGIDSVRVSASASAQLLIQP
jgi:Flp pilus assembly protein TadG